MPVLSTQINPRSEAFQANASAMQTLVDDLATQLTTVAQGGGEAPRAKHLARGKLLPRDRVAQLLDAGSPFLEVAPLAALAALAAGLVMAILADSSHSVAVTLLAAAVLGCGYGMALIGGLLEVQRIAGPDDLAGLTAVYYTLTYIGFAFPALLAWIAQTFPDLGYREFFGFGLVMIVIALALVLLGGRARPVNP